MSKLEHGIGPFEYNGYNYYVAPANTRVQRTWGLFGANVSLPEGQGDPNLGDYNTDVLTSSAYSLTNDGHDSIGAPAAEYCRRLGPDWYLPNINEAIVIIYDNREAIDDMDVTTGPTLNKIGTDLIQTSTNYNTEYAFCLRVYDNVVLLGHRDNKYWVVPVRREPID